MGDLAAVDLDVPEPSSGPDGLADRRTARNGGKRKPTAGQQAELYDAPQQPPPGGGLWTSPRVATYTRGRWGVHLRPDWVE